MKGTYRAFAKIYISNSDDGPEAAFGNGLVSLLRGVRDLGSLNKAAKDMHMAYSKAWKLMNSAEDRFGAKLIERDGARGSALTPEAEELIDAFDTVSREANEFAARRLREELSGL